jgi:hypothetical protein
MHILEHPISRVNHPTMPYPNIALSLFLDAEKTTDDDVQ